MINRSITFNHEPTDANFVYVHILALISTQHWQNLAIGESQDENKTGYVSVLLPFDGPKQNMMSTPGFMTGCVDTTTAANQAPRVKLNFREERTEHQPASLVLVPSSRNQPMCLSTSLSRWGSGQQMASLLRLNKLSKRWIIHQLTFAFTRNLKTSTAQLRSSLYIPYGHI